MIRLGGHSVGSGQPLLVIAGPDIIESAEHTLRHARRLADITRTHGLPFIFKCSFDKANRTSGAAFRGPGLVEGLRILGQVKREVGVPVLTDVHETAQVAAVAEVADVLQVPAFLCRQTDLVVAVARSGRGVNLKKGQFVAPLDMLQAVRKATEAGNPNVLVTERGATFGYHNLVVDMRGLYQMRSAGLAVCFDATHSVQLPSAQGTASGGERTLVPVLARAAVAAGVDALFSEVHETPDTAPCDGPCSLTPDMFDSMLGEAVAIRRALGERAPR
jgi:2-dehydro-3-deoxyphosphooctonate aldolase (KDO 8-P synthase)